MRSYCLKYLVCGLMAMGLGGPIVSGDVIPIMEGISPGTTDDQLLAHFGYYNSSPTAVSIPKGVLSRNYFDPGPFTYGVQPNQFLPGRHVDAFQIPFYPDYPTESTPFPRNVTWYLSGHEAAATAQSNAFVAGTFGIVYQGQLKLNGNAVSGSTDVQFALFDAPSGGTSVHVYATTLDVKAGLCTATLPFDHYLIPGSNRWLEIAVRNPAGSGEFSTLTPRQPLMHTPLAYRAEVAASVPWSGITDIPANWVPFGTDLAYGRGNVLIGAGTPLGKLEIQAGANSDGSQAGNAIALAHYTGGLRHWIRSRHGYGPSASNAIEFFLNESSDRDGSTAPGIGSVHMLSICGNGVGIGRQIPVEKLDVDGTIQTTGFKLTTGAGEGSVLTSDANGVGTWRASPAALWEMAGSDIFNTSAAKIGIGTSSPATTLDVMGTIQSTGFQLPTDAGEGRVLTSNAAGAAAWKTPVEQWLTNGSHIYNANSGGVGIGTHLPLATLHIAAPIAPGLRIQNTTTHKTYHIGIAASDGRLSIGENGTVEYVSINGGKVGIGTSSPGVFNLAVNGDAAKPGGGSWSVFSDARLKHNIERMKAGALDKLLSLHGYTFEYDQEAVEKRLALPGQQTGMIAQEVEQVFPEWVSKDADGYRYITERGTTALTIEAFRELRAEKDKELEALQKENREMWARLEKLEKVTSELQERTSGKS